MKKILKKITGLIFILMLITIWAIYSYEGSAITASTNAISSTKISWGIKRAKNNEQPDLGKTNLTLMQEYGRNCNRK